MRKDNKLFTLYLFYGINFISMGMTTFAPKFYGDIGLTDGRIGLISSVTALVGLFISASLGGKFNPVSNFQVFRFAPIAMLQAALCPALILVALALLWPATFTPAPAFVGLMLYEACRTPFRRTPLESRGMNRLLLIVGGAALLGFIAFRFLIKIPLSDVIAMTCASLLIAALCAFGMFGKGL